MVSRASILNTPRLLGEINYLHIPVQVKRIAALSEEKVGNGFFYSVIFLLIYVEHVINVEIFSTSCQIYPYMKFF